MRRLFHSVTTTQLLRNRTFWVGVAGLTLLIAGGLMLASEQVQAQGGCYVHCTGCCYGQFFCGYLLGGVFLSGWLLHTNGGHVPGLRQQFAMLQRLSAHV